MKGLWIVVLMPVLGGIFVVLCPDNVDKDKVTLVFNFAQSVVPLALTLWSKNSR